MPAKKLTSFVSVILTVALIWSSLGAGLLSAPVEGTFDVTPEENAPFDADAAANEPEKEISKPYWGNGHADETVRPTSSGGLTYPAGTIPANWSFRDAHNVPEVEQMGYTGDGVRVAVVDTGIDFGAQNLEGKYMVVDDPESPYHGWPVAFDAYGLPEFIMAKEATPGMGGIANTSINGRLTCPWNWDATTFSTTFSCRY